MTTPTRSDWRTAWIHACASDNHFVRLAVEGAVEPPTGEGRVTIRDGDKVIGGPWWVAFYGAINGKLSFVFDAARPLRTLHDPPDDPQVEYTAEDGSPMAFDAIKLELAEVP